jgi:hypothetical protein
MKPMERKPDSELSMILKLSDTLADLFELVTGEKIIEPKNTDHESKILDF